MYDLGPMPSPFLAVPAGTSPRRRPACPGLRRGCPNCFAPVPLRLSSEHVLLLFETTGQRAHNSARRRGRLRSVGPIQPGRRDYRVQDLSGLRLDAL